MDLKEAQESLKNKGTLIDYNPEIMGVTQSMLTTWMDCEAKARHYSKGLTSHEGTLSPALAFGSMFHDFQDYILTHIQTRQIISYEQIRDNIHDIAHAVWYEFKWREAYKEANATSKDNINYAHEFMLELIPRYFKFYALDFLFFTWVQVEGEFNVNIHNIPVRGKRDGVMRVTDTVNNRFGTFLMEHKTKSRFDTEVLQKSLPFNFQTNVYALTYALEFGKMLAGVCYNVIRKPALRKKVTESTKQFIARCMTDIDARPQYYFIRFWNKFTPTHMAMFEQTFSNQLLKFKAWHAQGEQLDVRNTTKCQAIYGTCQYLDYCMSCGKDVAMLSIKDKLFTELS